MPLLYDIGKGLYHTGIRVAALFNPKARQWVDGRRGIRERLQARREILKGCLWMHCASVGEFEQGLPVLEALRNDRPTLPILVTFFSPSGYEARKDHPIATHVDYLPTDSPRNARMLVGLAEPSAALFVRYEFWYHHLAALARAKVPVFLISAIFRPQHPFFKWYGGVWRNMLRRFQHVFVQDETSRALLESIGIANVSISGDTRFDRVAQIVQASEDLPVAAAFRGEGPMLVCGSTWPEDEALLLAAFAGMERSPKCLVAPHEMKEEQLQRIDRKFPKPLVRWSELEGSPVESITDVLGAERDGTLLLDRMGLLSRIYRYGTVAYVGGGFGDGIHSLLEPAAWGCPVIFGPKHRKFAEAQGLIDAGAGFEVRNAEDLQRVLEKLLSDDHALADASKAAREFVRNRCGSARLVADALIKQI